MYRLQDKENVEYVLRIEQALLDAMTATVFIPTTANVTLLPAVARKTADRCVVLCCFISVRCIFLLILCVHRLYCVWVNY